MCGVSIFSSLQSIKEEKKKKRNSLAFISFICWVSFEILSPVLIIPRVAQTPNFCYVRVFIFLKIIKMGREALLISAARDQTQASHLKGRWTTKRANQETHYLGVTECYSQFCHKLQPFKHSILWLTLLATNFSLIRSYYYPKLNKYCNPSVL